MRIITIGFRCTSDSILTKFNLRNFSGPFSFLICDFETSINLIKNNFKDYFKNIKKIDNYDEKIKYLNYWRQSKTFFVNLFYTQENINKINYYINNILLWNHHNMFDKEILLTFNRRIERIMHFLNNDKCLLFYIDRIYEQNNIDIYIEKINEIIINNYNYDHKIIYVIPFINKKYNDFDSLLYKKYNLLNIWLLKTTPIIDLEIETKKKNIKKPLLDTDINDKNINWNILIENIKYEYNL